MVCGILQHLFLDDFLWNNFSLHISTPFNDFPGANCKITCKYSEVERVETYHSGNLVVLEIYGVQTKMLNKYCVPLHLILWFNLTVALLQVDEETNWLKYRWSDEKKQQYLDEEMESEVKRRGLKTYQVKSAEVRGWRWGPKIKVAQNVLKYILDLEFLKSNKMFKLFAHK